MAVTVSVLVCLIALLLVYPLLRTILGLIADPALGGLEASSSLLDPSILNVLRNTAQVVVRASAGHWRSAGLAERADGHGLRGVGEFLQLLPLLVPPLAGV